MNRRQILGAGTAGLLAVVAHARPASANCGPTVGGYVVVPPATGVDDTANIMAAIASCPPWGTVCFPVGSYRVTQTIQPAGKIVHLSGSRGNPGFPYPNNGTHISGDLGGYLIRMGVPGGNLGYGPIIQGLVCVNENAAGGGIRLDGSMMIPAIRDVVVQARGVGIFLDGTAMGSIIDHVQCTSSGNPGGSIGILAPGHCQILSCDIAHWDHGIRAYGATTNITGCRIEVNRSGMVLGADASNNNWVLSRSTIAGNSFEANDTAIAVRDLADSVLQGMGLDGTTNAPSGASQYGIDVLGYMKNVLIAGLGIGGMSIAGVRIQNLIHRRVTFQNVEANSWDVQCPVGEGFVDFCQTNSGL